MTYACPAAALRCRANRTSSAHPLPAIAARFLAQPAPRAEAAAFVLATGGRVFAAARGHRPTWADAVVVGTLIVAMPFVEWLVHSRLLHARPIQWRGRSLQSAAARAHAAHHADPRNERLIVTPLPALLPLLPLVAVAGILPSWSLRATAVAMLTLLVLATEWVHDLVHASLSPKSAWLRRRSRAHRLHHYRNERYWFGLTSGLADAAMRTAPNRDETFASRHQASHAGISAMEVHAAEDHATQDCGGEPVNGNAERRPPAGVGHELVAFLPKVFQPMPDVGSDQEPRGAGHGHGRQDDEERGDADLGCDHSGTTIGHRESDVHGSDERDRHCLHGGWRQPPEGERRRGGDDAEDHTPVDGHQVALRPFSRLTGSRDCSARSPHADHRSDALLSDPSRASRFSGMVMGRSALTLAPPVFPTG